MREGFSLHCKIVSWFSVGWPSLMEVAAVQGGYVAKWCPRHLAALSSHLSAVRLLWGLWNDDYRGESSPNRLISAIFRLVTYQNSNRFYHFVSLVVILGVKWLSYSLVDMAWGLFLHCYRLRLRDLDNQPFNPAAHLCKPCLIPEGYTCIWYLFTVYLGMILGKKTKFPGEKNYLLFIWIHLFWNCCGPIHVAAVDGILIHFGWMTSEQADGSSIDVQLPPVACGWSEHNVGSKAYVM